MVMKKASESCEMISMIFPVYKLWRCIFVCCGIYLLSTIFVFVLYWVVQKKVCRPFQSWRAPSAQHHPVEVWNLRRRAWDRKVPSSIPWEGLWWWKLLIIALEQAQIQEKIEPSQNIPVSRFYQMFPDFSQFFPIFH